MASVSGRRRRPRACGLSNCNKEALYECPKCALPYCSVPCYKGHSEYCVKAFADESIEPLRGVNVSNDERRKFHKIVERIREAGFGGGSYEDPVIEDDDAETEQRDGSSSETEPEERVSPDEVPKLLEQFMNELDDDGKDLIFSVLNAGMEEREREGAQGSEQRDASGSAEGSAREGRGATSPLGFSDTRTTSSPQQTNAGKKREAQQLPRGDMIDALEQLAEEIEQLDLSHEEILARLPGELIHDFERWLRDGRAERFVAVWQPWWIISNEKEAVGEKREGVSVVNDESVEVAQLPILPRKEQLLVPAQIPKKNASPCVIYSVVDVLAAYCLSMRLCNGEWTSDSFHTARKIWELSRVLSEDQRYENMKDACASCLARLIEVEKSRDAAVEAFSDTSAILAGNSDWVARALFECQRIFEAALPSASTSARKHIKARLRKVAYFVSWALCQDTNTLSSAARAVLSFADLEKGSAEEVRAAENALRLMRRQEDSKPLITVLE